MHVEPKSLSCNVEREVCNPFFSGGGLEIAYQKEKKMTQVKQEEGRGRIGRRRTGRCG